MNCAFRLTKTVSQGIKIKQNNLISIHLNQIITLFVFPVNSAPESECNLYGHIHINASASMGYLASTTAFSSRPGTLGCPWLLEVEPYQLINITLIDFSDRAMTSHTLFGDNGPPLGKCY